jgi:hypothetical protein
MFGSSAEAFLLLVKVNSVNIEHKVVDVQLTPSSLLQSLPLYSSVTLEVQLLLRELTRSATMQIPPG